jgi:hypothetical protein
MLLHGTQIVDASIPASKINGSGGAFEKDVNNNISQTALVHTWGAGSVKTVNLAYGYGGYLSNHSSYQNTFLGIAPPYAVSGSSQTDWNIFGSSDLFGVYLNNVGTGAISNNIVFSGGTDFRMQAGVAVEISRNHVLGQGIFRNYTGSTRDIVNSYVLGQGIISSTVTSNTVDVRANMIVSSWGTRYSNSIVDSGRNTIISSKNVSITNASLYNVVIGVDGLTLSAKNNTASPMTYMGKITVGRGTSGALTTTGATHALGYNSTTGEVSRVGLAGTSIVGTPTYTITSNHPYPLSTTATYSVILAGFATGTLAGSYLVSIGEAMYQYQASGSATLNVLIGNSNKTGVKTAIGTGHVSQRNVLIGNSNQTIINTTSGNTNKQTDNFFMGRNNKIQITGTSTSAHSYSNIVSGYGVTVTQQGGVRFNKNYINGYTGGLNLTSAFGVDDSFMFGLQATHTLSKGGIYDATIIANNLLGLTGSIYDSALISNKSLTVNGVWNSAVIGNETCTLSHVTASTAGVDNSLIAATKTFSNGGYVISNSAVIGVEGLTLTAALARTVVLPKLRIGIGTGATLPALVSGYSSLGIDNTTGDVGTFAAPSDARLKNVVADLQGDSAMDMVRKLKPVLFTWNLDKMPNNPTDEIAGFLAQDVQKVKQELVHNVFEIKGEKYLGIKEKQFNAILTAAIKQLDERVTALEKS